MTLRCLKQCKNEKEHKFDILESQKNKSFHKSNCGETLNNKNEILSFQKVREQVIN